MKDFWNNYGGLIIAVSIFLAIALLISCLIYFSKPDYTIYEFHTVDGVVTFEVSALIDQDYSYYTFRLTDGRKVIYHADYGSTVYCTDVYN